MNRKKGFKHLIRKQILMSLFVTLILLLSSLVRSDAKVEEMDKLVWTKDISSSIGDITISEDGKEVTMTGNPTDAGKNAIYLIPANHQEQTIQYTYNVDYGDSFIASGILLNVKKDGNQLKGYMLSFNNPGYDFANDAGGNLAAVWTFTYNLNDNSSNNIPRTLVKSLNIPQSGNMVIVTNSDSIKIITSGVNETINIDHSVPTGDGFGFFTVHYSHGCNMIGNFALTNCVFTTIDLLPHNLYVNPNGGKWNNSTSVSTLTGIYGDKKNIPLPVRDGYTFVGWTKTGSSGTMSTLTGNATYTFGEDEETDDTITAQWMKMDASKSCNVSSGKVAEGQEITYTITANNRGTVDGRIIIKDGPPPGTTFVANSIVINGTAQSYSQQNLANGISLTISASRSATLSFRVKVNKLTNNTQIKNTAQYKDVTVASNPPDVNTNEVTVKYVEPIISYSKSQTTQYGQSYVRQGEKITYKITISNEGGQAKQVTVKDSIPSGTTFVSGSVKINGVANTSITADNLRNGVNMNIPAETANRTLTFEVTVNDINDEDIIRNTGSVDNKNTNQVTARYVEPIISKRKEIRTAKNLAYVVNGEKITYTIVINNAGGLGKNVVVKDLIPTGTNFVAGSVKINGVTNSSITADNLKNGVTVNSPAKVANGSGYVASVTKLSFDVTVKDINDEDIIRNTATVDNGATNQVTARYVEPIISQRKEVVTQHNLAYVVNGERITYTIVINNAGGLGKDVIVKDVIPTGTSFVAGSVKINGVTNSSITADNLRNGVTVNSPAKLANGSGYVASVIKVSFDVTVNDINDEYVIRNKATVDNNNTNEVKNRYVEPIIRQRKDVETEHNLDYVVNGEKIKYTIVIYNSGGLGKDIIVKDAVPEGTTLIPGSVKINGATVLDEANNQITASVLGNGIRVSIPKKVEKSASDTTPLESPAVQPAQNTLNSPNVINYKPSVTKISFEVTVNDIDDEYVIKNKAIVDNVTTNEVKNRYVEPIIRQRKDVETEHNLDYVVNGEKIKYTIVIYNSGGLGKDIIVKDAVPEGTTLIPGSVKINGATVLDEANNQITASVLGNGIRVSIPKKVEKSTSDTTPLESPAVEPAQNTLNSPNIINYKPSVTKISFEVTVNDIDDEYVIRNKATVDNVTTNEVKSRYVEPIITQRKDVETEHNLDYVVNGEKIKYTIVVYNSGGLGKDVIVKDVVPEGTTLIPGSVKINDKIVVDEGKNQVNNEQLANGIGVSIPKKVEKSEADTTPLESPAVEPAQNTLNSPNIINYKPSVTKISFEVTVNDIDDEYVIRNKATVDDETTNEVKSRYVEPIITQRKDVETEHKLDYVVNGEKIKYTIVVYNSGGLGKDIIVKDTVPVGTTLVQGSVKINEEVVLDSEYKEINDEQLAEGIKVSIPKKVVRDESDTTEIESPAIEPAQNTLNSPNIIKYKPSVTKVSFEVTVDDIEDEDIIRNKATVDNNSTNEVTNRYVEPIISQKKEIETENNLGYVVNGEKIKYTIVVKNEGGLDKEVVVKDLIPEGTTFVEGSVKLNGEDLLDEYENHINREQLENGLKVLIPTKIKKDTENSENTDEIEKTKKNFFDYIFGGSKEEENTEKEEEKTEEENTSKEEKKTEEENTSKEEEKTEEENTSKEDEKTEGENTEKEEEKKDELESINYEPSITTISFEVTVNDINDEEIIKNIATVDDNSTNEVIAKYSEPIISQKKESTTQYGKDYVVGGEKITYSIIIQNDGTLEKEVVVKDKVPKGTTFVEGSIKVDGNPYKDESGEDLKKKDLKNGITVKVPPKEYVGKEVEDIPKQEASEENKETNEESKEIKEENKETNEENKETNEESKEAKEENKETNEESKETKEENKETKEEVKEFSELGKVKEKIDYIPGKTVLTFEVLVKDLKKDTDTADIINKATVDDEETNDVVNVVYPFNMKIDKTVKGMTLNGKYRRVGNEKLAKTEIKAKKISETSCVTTYSIIVTNTGKVEGSAVVEDIIPKGFKVSRTNPSYWKNAGDNKIQATTKTIKPGKSEELIVQLEWDNGKDNFGIKKNKARIIETSNESNAKETSTKDNKSDATIIVGIATGEFNYINIIICLIAGGLLIALGIVILKKVL